MSGSVPTTRPNLAPDDMTSVPRVDDPQGVLHLGLPFISVGQQVQHAYTSVAGTSVVGTVVGGAASTFSTVVSAPSLPSFTVYRSDTAWLSIESEHLADAPWLAVPDAIAMRSARPDGTTIDWAKDDDGVLSVEVAPSGAESGDQKFIVRAKGIDDVLFLDVVSHLQWLPRPLFVDDPTGILQKMGLRQQSVVEADDVLEAVTFGSVQAGSVYGTANGPVVVRAASNDSVDPHDFDLLTVGVVRHSTEGRISGMLRATHDDFITWVDAGTRFTITAPAGTFDLDQLADHTALVDVRTSTLSSLPLSMFDAVQNSLHSVFDASDGWWAVTLTSSDLGRPSVRLMTCSSALVVTSADGQTCTSRATTMAPLVGVPHRVAVPGATLVVGFVDAPSGSPPVARLTASSPTDKKRTVEFRRRSTGQTFAGAIITLSPGVPVTRTITP
jgi:hypothetical protein